MVSNSIEVRPSAKVRAQVTAFASHMAAVEPEDLSLHGHEASHTLWPIVVSELEFRLRARGSQRRFNPSEFNECRRSLDYYALEAKNERLDSTTFANLAIRALRLRESETALPDALLEFPLGSSGYDAHPNGARRLEYEAFFHSISLAVSGEAFSAMKERLESLSLGASGQWEEAMVLAHQLDLVMSGRSEHSRRMLRFTDVNSCASSLAQQCAAWTVNALEDKRTALLMDIHPVDAQAILGIGGGDLSEAQGRALVSTAPEWLADRAPECWS